ncbi:MAG: SDR family oxidoreductase [Gemmobacter sp.]|nr:SDR family oxidoreductase [Gemmobacter sp.]
MTTVITGASRGIGHGLATAFAALGPVIATHRGQAPDAPALPGLEWQTLDVTAQDSSPDSPRALGSRLTGRPVDLLVCNAGVYLGKGLAFEDLKPDHWAQTFAVNVTGVARTIQALLPNLAKGKRPRIAIIASAMGSDTRAPGGAYIYRASKAAALNLGRNLAVDLKPRGIAVGIYHPGWVKTDMGGDGADIDADTSVAGLIAQFSALDLQDTGCFRNYDGSPIPF